MDELEDMTLSGAIGRMRKNRRPGGIPVGNIGKSPNPAIQKLLEVAAAQGWKNMDKQQVTTRVVYDMLPLVAAATTMTFFQNCGSRTFPRTNLTQNRLEVNEAVVFERISFHIVTFSAAGALPVVSVEPLATTFAGMYRSDFSIDISNSQVVKPVPIDTQHPDWNRNARHTAYEVIHFASHLVLVPQTEFLVNMRTTNTTTSTTKEIMCMLEGVGMINSPVARY